MSEEQAKSPIEPTIGRIVLYTHKNGVEQPAIITRVHDNTFINITVFYDEDTPGYQIRVPYSEDITEHRTWHWMPYQLAQAAK